MHGNFRVIISHENCAFISLFVLSFSFYRVRFRESDQTLTRSTCARYILPFAFPLPFFPHFLFFLMKQYRSLYVSFHLHIFFLNKTKKHSFIGQYKEQSIPLKIIKNKNVFQSYSKNSIFFIVCDLFRISYILFIFCKKKKKNFITRISLSRNFSPTDSLLLRISLLRNSFLVEKFSDNKILCNLKNFLGIK